MSEVSEALERAEHTEHAAHAGHGDHGGGHAKPVNSRAMGLTIAILGVLLAFCAALVGSERTELVKTMVEQSNTNNGYEAESTRYRTTLAQVEALNSVTPAEESGLEKTLSSIGADAKPENADIVAAIRAAVRVQLTQGGPDADTIARLVHLARSHQKTAESAKKWTEAYEQVVRAHYEAAEGFERAQVAVEVAIVLASIALLLFRRSVWAGSLLVGVAGIALMVLTYTKTHGEIHEGEEKLEAAHKAYEKQTEAGQKESDEEVLSEMEKDFKLEEPANGGAE